MLLIIASIGYCVVRVCHSSSSVTIVDTKMQVRFIFILPANLIVLVTKQKFNKSSGL
eukprot:m.267311 g.267311  ORF g.267311 m.267311 type:complete len:57 (-) comp16246_c1_seq26:465-635(-)